MHRVDAAKRLFDSIVAFDVTKLQQMAHLEGFPAVARSIAFELDLISTLRQSTGSTVPCEGGEDAETGDSESDREGGDYDSDGDDVEDDNDVDMQVLVGNKLLSFLIFS